MTLKGLVAAAYELKIGAHQISYLIKYNQLLQLKFICFDLKDVLPKSNVCHAMKQIAVQGA